MESYYQSFRGHFPDLSYLFTIVSPSKYDLIAFFAQQEIGFKVKEERKKSAKLQEPCMSPKGSSGPQGRLELPSTYSPSVYLLSDPSLSSWSFFFLKTPPSHLCHTHIPTCVPGGTPRPTSLLQQGPTSLLLDL